LGRKGGIETKETKHSDGREGKNAQKTWAGTVQNKKDNCLEIFPTGKKKKGSLVVGGERRERKWGRGGQEIFFRGERPTQRKGSKDKPKQGEESWGYKKK